MFYQPQINFLPEEVIDYLRKSQSDDPTLTVEEVLSKHEAILDVDEKAILGIVRSLQKKTNLIVLIIYFTRIKIIIIIITNNIKFIYRKNSIIFI